MDGGRAVGAKTHLTRVTTLCGFDIGLQLPLGNAEALTAHPGGVLEGRGTKGLAVSAEADRNQLGVSNRGPCDPAAMAGSVNMHIFPRTPKAQKVFH